MERALTVLAVEVEPQHARRLAECLAILGHLSRLAASPAEALRLLRSEIFDGAVVAIELGLEEGSILQRVACLPATRFLLATGPPGDEAGARLARAAGANACLARPVDPAMLAAHLAHAGARSPPTGAPRD